MIHVSSSESKAALFTRSKALLDYLDKNPGSVIHRSNTTEDSEALKPARHPRASENSEGSEDKEGKSLWALEDTEGSENSEGSEDSENRRVLRTALYCGEYETPKATRA